MRVRTIAQCPKDCPDRRAVPNCHDPERCAVWAAYLDEMRAIREGQRQAEEPQTCLTAARERALFGYSR